MWENSVWGQGYPGGGSTRIYSDSLMELHSTLSLQYPIKIKVSGKKMVGVRKASHFLRYLNISFVFGKYCSLHLREKK